MTAVVVAGVLALGAVLLTAAAVMILHRFCVVRWDARPVWEDCAQCNGLGVLHLAGGKLTKFPKHMVHSAIWAVANRQQCEACGGQGLIPYAREGKQVLG